MLKKIPHQFEVQEDSRAAIIPLEIKRPIVLILKEALHNIVRHSEASAVQIDFTLDRQMLKLTIVDNGKGFDAAKVHEGHGLVNIKQRAANIGGNCVIVSSPGNGTRLSLKVRLS